MLDSVALCPAFVSFSSFPASDNSCLLSHAWALFVLFFQPRIVSAFSLQNPVHALRCINSSLFSYVGSIAIWNLYRVNHLVVFMFPSVSKNRKHLANEDQIHVHYDFIHASTYSLTEQMLSILHCCRHLEYNNDGEFKKKSSYTAHVLAAWRYFKVYVCVWCNDVHSP